MTEPTPTKTCSTCGKDLPATEEFFYPSYLERGGKNMCRACHKERGKNTITYRAKLRERATPIASEQVPLYKSLSSIAMALGLTAAAVEHDIFDRNLPVYAFIYNKVGPALALLMEDADAYIQEQAQNGSSQKSEADQLVNPRPDNSVSADLPQDIEGIPQNGHQQPDVRKTEVMGSPDTCGCCKNDRGNILAVHNTDQEVVAYLCSACYRAARSFDWEPERLRAVAKLIETIGGNIDRSRR